MCFALISYCLWDRCVKRAIKKKLKTSFASATFCLKE